MTIELVLTLSLLINVFVVWRWVRFLKQVGVVAQTVVVHRVNGITVSTMQVIDMVNVCASYGGVMMWSSQCQAGDKVEYIFSLTGDLP